MNIVVLLLTHQLFSCIIKKKKKKHIYGSKKSHKCTHSPFHRAVFLVVYRSVTTIIFTLSIDINCIVTPTVLITVNVIITMKQLISIIFELGKSCHLNVCTLIRLHRNTSQVSGIINTNEDVDFSLECQNSNAVRNTLVLKTSPKEFTHL